MAKPITHKFWADDEIEMLKDGKMTTNELSDKLGRTMMSVQCKAKKLGIRLPHSPAWNKLGVNSDFFKEWSHDMSYIFGYWMADGCIRTCNRWHIFSISSNDIDHLESIKNVMDSHHNIIMDRRCGVLSIGDKTIYHDIQQLGGKERKSLINTYPYVPNEYEHDFIRGYFDGDGSVVLQGKYNYPKVSFVGTEEFLSALAKKLDKCITKFTIVQHHPERGSNNNNYVLWFSGKNALSVLNYMYVDDTGMCLERKHDRYLHVKMWNNIDHRTKPYIQSHAQYEDLRQ